MGAKFKNDVPVPDSSGSAFTPPRFISNETDENESFKLFKNELYLPFMLYRYTLFLTK